MKISKNRLQDNAYAQLLEFVLNGDIAAGQIMTIQALSEMFGISTTPIREALQRLVAMQALTVVSGRSIGVPPLSMERLTDLNRVRCIFEGATAEWAVDNVSDSVIDQLDKIEQSMESAIRKRDVKRFLKLNREFHFVIYRLSGSKTACETIERYWLQASPFFHQMYTLNRYEHAKAGHRTILDALKRRDKQGVARGIREDIQDGSQLLADVLLKSQA
jgi:DNA-binding GntR family transcriptional regulator